VGENRDNDDENQRTREREPHQRPGGNACRRVRHRHPTLQVASVSVKSDAKKPRNTIDSSRATGHCEAQMSRPQNAAKKVIFAFAARIALR
jgi:hypothetical protein